MTDAELEELGKLLEDLRLWLNAAPLHLCPTRDARIRGDMDKFYVRVEAKCGTIRSLREENAARDRVVEEARGVWAERQRLGSEPPACSCRTIQTDLTDLGAALAALEEKS